VNKGRLPLRGDVCAELPLAEQRHRDDDDEKGDPPSREHLHGNHAAIMAAITCGNSATSTTMVAEIVRMATDPRLRVEH